MEKKKLELGPKDEQVYDIIIAKYCSIIEEDKLRNKYFWKMSQYKSLQFIITFCIYNKIVILILRRYLSVPMRTNAGATRLCFL